MPHVLVARPVVVVGVAWRCGVVKRFAAVLRGAGVWAVARGGCKVHEPRAVGVVAAGVRKECVAAVGDDIGEVVLVVIAAVEHERAIVGHAVVVCAAHRGRVGRVGFGWTRAVLGR